MTKEKIIDIERELILDSIQFIQDQINQTGFKGQNEYDLHLRIEIADYIIARNNTITLESCGNCNEMVEMMSTGEICPKCFC